MTVADPTLVARLDTVTQISSALGILGALLTLLSYRFSPRFNIPMARLISYLAVAYLVGAVCTLLGPAIAREPFGPLCKITGLLLQISDLLAVILMFYIGLGLLLVTFGGYKPSNVRDLDWHFFVGGLIVSLAVGLPWLWILPGNQLRPVYFSMTSWCWISKTYPWVQAGILQLPMLAVLLFDLLAFVFVGLRIWTRSRAVYAKNEKVRDAVRLYIMSSLAYILLFSLCWIPETLSLIVLYATGSSTYWQIFTRSVIFPARGLINFALYILLTGMAGQLGSNWSPAV